MTEPADPHSVFQLPDVPYSAVIFDCDGTLADSMPLQHQAWLHGLRSQGASFDFTWEVFVSRAGMSLQATVAELNAQFGESLDHVAVGREKEIYYERHRTSVRPVDEVLDFAREAAQRGPVAVASGSPDDEVRRTLMTIRALDLFEIIITPKDVARGKPAPDMFLLAASRMGVAPEQCLVFEDAVLGMLAAERAGMHPVYVEPRSVRVLKAG